MGTEITLDVGGVSITYSKNHRGIDHGSLFQEPDRKPLRSDQLDYKYYASEHEDPTSAEMAFTRPLKDVVPRLELLGFNLDRVRREYESVAESWREERRSFMDDDTKPLPDLMSFAEFRQFAIEHALESLDDTFVSGANGESAEKIRGALLTPRWTEYQTIDPTMLMPIRSGAFSAGWSTSCTLTRSCGSWRRGRRTRALLSFGSNFSTSASSVPMTSMMPIPMLTQEDVLRRRGAHSSRIVRTGVVLSGSKLIASESHLDSSRAPTYWPSGSQTARTGTT